MCERKRKNKRENLSCVNERERERICVLFGENGTWHFVFWLCDLFGSSENRMKSSLKFNLFFWLSFSFLLFIFLLSFTHTHTHTHISLLQLSFFFLILSSLTGGLLCVYLGMRPIWWNVEMSFNGEMCLSIVGEDVGKNMVCEFLTEMDCGKYLISQNVWSDLWETWLSDIILTDTLASCCLLGKKRECYHASEVWSR